MSFKQYTQQPLFKDWKENIINLEIGPEDIKRIELFMDEIGSRPGDYMAIFATHTWKCSFTPAWGGESGWLSLTCKLRSHPLNGKTINIENVDTESWLQVGAWVVEFVAGLEDDRLDRFLNYGSSTFDQIGPLGPKNDEPDNEIPF
jgi:hypothetical protein